MLRNSIDQRECSGLLHSVSTVHGDSLLAPRIKTALKKYNRRRFVEAAMVRCKAAGKKGSTDKIDFTEDVPIRIWENDEGQTLSAISKPSFIVRLLAHLDLRDGETVLEAGSGTGWLLALLKHQVGRRGHVIGIEIIRCLARASLDVLRGYDLEDISVLATDFDSFHPQCKLDAVIFTSATKSLPQWIGKSLSTGNGRLAVPIAIPGGGDCLTIFHRAGEFLVSSAMELTLSVPTTGVLMGNYLWAPSYSEVCQNSGIDGTTLSSRPWSRSPLSQKNFIVESLPIRAFLAMRRRNFFAANLDDNLPLSGSTLAFGIADPQTASLAMVTIKGLHFCGREGSAVADGLMADLNSTWSAGSKPLLTGLVQVPVPNDGQVSILSSMSYSAQ